MNIPQMGNLEWLRYEAQKAQATANFAQTSPSSPRAMVRECEAVGDRLLAVAQELEQLRHLVPEVNRYHQALERIAETECHADEVCDCKRRMAREALEIEQTTAWKSEHEQNQFRDRLAHEERLRREAEAGEQKLAKSLEQEMRHNSTLRSSLWSLLHYARNCGCTDHEMLDKAAELLR